MVVASVYGLDLAREFKLDFPDCRFCRGPEAIPNRERWGCDAPTDEPVYNISCPCSGADPACPRCEGSGEIPQPRCPTMAMAEDRVWLERFMYAYLAWDARHTLPGPGGLVDQAATFVQAVAIADSERGVWERERQAMRKKRQGNGGK